MFLYHEISSDSLESILREGLKRTTRGEKGNDEDIIKTDKHLDVLRPSSLKDVGLSRSNNIYAFMGDANTIIDIKNGATISLEEYMTGRRSVLLRLAVSPEYCYVSDLDKYDKVKSLLLSGDDLQVSRCAREYWNSVMELSLFQPGKVIRPEVMIVKDLPPKAISTYSTE